MSVSLQKSHTGRFLDIFPYLSLLATLGVMLALILSNIFPTTLLSQSLNVEAGEPQILQPLQVKSQLIGALRIDAKAEIPTNCWVTYEIQLRDASGKVLLSGVKQGWNESGTWQDDGESGVWQESDLQAGMDVRTRRDEQVTIAVNVLDYTNTAGQDIDQAIPIELTVRNGVVDDRYLWTGFWGSLVLTLLAIFSVPTTGKRVISKVIDDSDVGDRAVMGGPGKLLRVIISITSDETSPPALDVNFFLKDRQGEQIFRQTYPVKLLLIKDDDGKVDRARGELVLFFELVPRSSYGIYVEVTPDGPVDRTRLTVLEGASTLGNVELVRIQSS